MIQPLNPFLYLSLLLASTGSFAQLPKPATDYLHVPGPIRFEDKSYGLNWSSHPAANFYKQEYLVKGDDADRFHSMVMLDVATGADIKQMVSAKVAELKKMKETNPMVNFEVISNGKTGEYMLDFLLTANAPDGTLAVAERNVYRYRSFTAGSGRAGVELFGVSTRAYGADATAFFTSLKSNRKDLVARVAGASMPDISLNK